MPNRVNVAMSKEYGARFGETPDLVAVSFRGLTVEETVELRTKAREQEIEMVVVKNSVARKVLSANLEKNGLEDVITGQTALFYGGEGLPDVARLIHEFAKKTGKLEVRGGIFERKVIPTADVEKFRSIPDRQTLLAQTLATIIAPLTGSLAAFNSLLRSPAALADALAKKKDGEG